MPKGGAVGKARQYQEYCRDILLKYYSERSLMPYKGGGVDITITGRGKTAITVDVVLIDPSGNLLVAECKRWGDSVDQGIVSKFAGDLAWLRAETGKKVTGVICTTKGFQDGAIKHATIAEGIEVVTCEEGNTLDNFGLTFTQYDENIDRNTRHYHTTGTAKISIKAWGDSALIQASTTPEDSP